MKIFLYTKAHTNQNMAISMWLCVIFSLFYYRTNLPLSMSEFKDTGQIKQLLRKAKSGII